MVMVSPVTPFQVAPPLLPLNLATQGSAYCENGNWATPGWHATPPTVTPVPTWTAPIGPPLPVPPAPVAPAVPVPPAADPPPRPPTGPAASEAAAPFAASPV